MNFKPWLESTEEQYSNEMTEKLCSWIKLHGRKPKVGSPPILAGSPTAGSRVSYNMDLEEHKLGEFLKDKIRSGQIYPSDQAILRRHGMEGLFENRRRGDKRAISLKNVEKLAEFYRKNGRYPSTRMDSDIEAKYLANWLSGKRSARKGKRTMVIYDGEVELGISLGLPDDWLDHDLQAKQAEQNELNLLKLAEFYKKNGRYPQERGSPEDRLLANWLRSKRRARKGMGGGKIYDGEVELGISLGLPDDWLDHDLQAKQAEQNELNLLKLAEFYKKNGRYPQEGDPDPEARTLAVWLRRKRSVRRGTRRGSQYDQEMELGIKLGLPEDWLDYLRNSTRKSLER